MDPYQVSPSEKFGCYGCEEGIPGGAPSGRFLKSSLRAPFHPYKRQLVEEAFPEAHLTMEGPPFKTASLEGYEEMAGTAAGGEAEMYASHLPELSAEPAWCKALRYNSAGQEPDPHTMVSVSGRIPKLCTETLSCLKASHVFFSLSFNAPPSG